MLRSSNAISNFLEIKRKGFEILSAKLHSLNPKAVLNRGYSIVMNKGQTIKTLSDVKIDDIIDIIIQKGKIRSKVMEVKNG